MRQNHLEGLIECRLLSPIPKVSDSVGLGGEKESAILQSSYMMLTLCRGHTLKITVLGYTAKSPPGRQLIKLGWTSSTS